MDFMALKLTNSAEIQTPAVIRGSAWIMAILLGLVGGLGAEGESEGVCGRGSDFQPAGVGRRR